MTSDGESSNISTSRGFDQLVELVTAENVNRLRLSSGSYFTPQRLALHIAQNQELVWRIRGENEYIIGGQWRHRPEIGHVLELSYGRYRDVLLPVILDVFRRQSVRLVVVGLEDFSLYLAFYAKFGFSRLDEIIEMERPGKADLPAVPEVPIQPMLPEDLPAALAVDSAAFPWLWHNSPEEFGWYGDQEGVEIYTARSGEGDIVGYAGMTIRGSEGHLDRLAVSPSHQGSGFGAALLHFSIAHMLQAGARRIALSTQTTNKISQRLYRWFGFRPTYRSQKIYGLWLDGGDSAVG